MQHVFFVTTVNGTANPEDVKKLNKLLKSGYTLINPPQAIVESPTSAGSTSSIIFVLETHADTNAKPAKATTFAGADDSETEPSSD